MEKSITKRICSGATLLRHIQKHEPTASKESASKLIDIWGEMVDSIINQMFTYSKEHTQSVHINLREEMALELANILSFISQKVVDNRLSGRSISEIDIKTEYQQCFGDEGKDKIKNTAIKCANHIWIERHRIRWEPKTVAALEREKKPKKTILNPKDVENNHFIPLSFIKKYWSNKQSVFKSVKCSDGTIEIKARPVGSWGYQKGLYSDYLEAYFGLIESDAARPIEMLLKMEPLNRPQREAFVGFIVIQRIRNPFFMKYLRSYMAPIVSSEVGEAESKDDGYMNSVYETLYGNNEFYDKIARPIMYSRWVMIHSEKLEFVLPDVCHIHGSYDEKKYLIMPLTPQYCFIVLPEPLNKPRVVPHNIKAPTSLVRDISTVLMISSVDSFLCDKTKNIITLNNEDFNEIIKRIFTSIQKLI
jgi:hypothetical protein